MLTAPPPSADEPDCPSSPVVKTTLRNRSSLLSSSTSELRSSSLTWSLLYWGGALADEVTIASERRRSAKIFIWASYLGIHTPDTTTAITTIANVANIGQRWRNSTAMRSRGVGNGCRLYRSIAKSSVLIIVSSSVLMSRLTLWSVYG